ncbi:MAG: glycosyltransferase family 2 protein [Deltaproteobacteria bacterium]|nr:glycosyltransferase family 2 protein [Deltaproteobacteria bacterium]
MDTVKHAPDISIILVNWNTRALLLQCIESLKRTAAALSPEIIVVDNASTDGSQAALRRLHPDVVLLCNTENLGFAKANNIGIRRSSGRFICLVNTDIKVLEGCLGLLHDYLERHPSAGMVGPLAVNEDLTPQFNCRKMPGVWNCFVESTYLHKVLPMFGPFRGRALPAASYARTHESECLCGCLVMVRRKAIEQVGLLDERFFFYSEDIDWCKRFSAAGWGIVFYPAAKAIHYRGSSVGAAPLHYLVQMEKARYQYWQKHHGVAAQAVYRLLKIFNCAVSALAFSGAYVFLSERRVASRNKIRGCMARLNWLMEPSRGAWKQCLMKMVRNAAVESEKIVSLLEQKK